MNQESTLTPRRGMKTKTINKILTGKFLAWSKSIEDEAVRKLVEENTIITGGAIASMLMGEKVNDFDVYLRTPEAAYAVAQYYVKKLLENPPPTFKSDDKHKVEIYAKLEPAIETGNTADRIGGKVVGPAPARVRIVVKSAGIAGENRQTDYQYFEGLRPIESAQASEAYVEAAVGGEYAEGQVTDMTEPEAYAHSVEELDNQPAETLLEGEIKPDKGGARPKYRVLFVTSNAITLSDSVQIVLRFQGEPNQIHENFDFVHCLSYWCSWNRDLVVNHEALLCIASQELKYQGSKFPICSIIRTRKFISRGWTINAGQFVKMCYQVSKLDMDDPSVLEEQLVGVDSAYFSQLIAKLKEKVDEKGDPMRVDGTYLMTLIDKIF